MPLTLADSRGLLQNVVDELWARDHKPILGSRLKATLIERALQRGSQFDQGSLGYPSFSAFISDSGIVAVRFRTGADILVAPLAQAAELDAASTEKRSEQRAHIREDFWKAFVGFPVAGEARAYDPKTDRVLVGSPSAIPPDSLSITPVSREEQVTWRWEFVESLGTDSPLSSQLKPGVVDGPARFMRDFSLAIRRDAKLLERWNGFWLDKVSAYIAGWARPHAISDIVWLRSADQKEDGNQRAQLYRALDQIPLDHLLELRIPLKWLLTKSGE